MQRLVYSNDVDRALGERLAAKDFYRLFVIADENTARWVWPRVATLRRATLITIAAGEQNKSLQSLAQVWRALQAWQATRQSLVVNLGGGVVTDLGGLAAATFKRGIRFMNVPTTLLGAVDAAVGGKTAINFGGLKNEIGCFQEAVDVIISTCFFKTLPRHELKSGYAEMLKHALLGSEAQLASLLDFPFERVDDERLLHLLQESIAVKQSIVRDDPHDQGARRALNLGHTVGHAFESLALKRSKPIAHGYAVAWGIVAELVLSHIMFRFPSETIQQMSDFVRTNYGAFPITCDDYDTLLKLMRHDKKSQRGEINCSLLAAIGDARLSHTVSDDDIKAALDIYRDLMGM